MERTLHTSYRNEFLKYAALNVLGMLGLSCYILADTFFISRGMGANGLTALNLAIPVYSFIHGSGLMLGMGGAIKYAIFRSQGRTEKTDGVFSVTVKAGVLAAVVFLLLGVFGSGALTGMLGADAEVFDMTNTYLRVILVFAPAFILNEILLCFVRNDGAPQLAMTAMVMGSLSNIVLDYLFIFPMKMGIFGAAVATGASPLISMGILSGHWLKKRNGFRFRWGDRAFSMLPSILSLGFPSLITELSSGVVIIVFNVILLGLLGNVGVAAYGVIANLSLVVMAVFTGIAQGVQPIISQAYGYGDRGKMKYVLGCAIWMMGLLAGGIYVGIFFGADAVTAVFNSENNWQLQQIARDGLKLYFTAAGFAGVNIIISMYFASTERAIPAHVLSMFRGLVVIVPMAFVLAKLWGVTGVWLAFPVTEVLMAVLGLGMYLWFQRKAG